MQDISYLNEHYSYKNSIAKKKEIVYKQIEQDVNNLNESMSMLNQLVRDQQQPIDTIEDFINNSKESVKEANNELEKAEEYSNSNNYLKYFGMLTGMIATTLIFFLKK